MRNTPPGPCRSPAGLDAAADGSASPGRSASPVQSQRPPSSPRSKDPNNKVLGPKHH